VKLAGRLAAVSGASSGIGAATARELATRAVRVALLARSKSKLDAVARAIEEADGIARVYSVDLSDGTATSRAAKQLKHDLGPPDIIVNCAGAGRWLDIEKTSSDEAIQMMGAPYFAAFNLTRAFMADMLARGSGRIVNVNSPAAYVPWPGATGYAAARWAMRGLTQALRADLAGSGVGVIEVIAGETDSPYWENNPGTRERKPRISRFLGRLTPEQVARAIVHGLERDRATVIIPFSVRAAIALHEIWSWPVAQLVVATGRRRKPPAVRDQDDT
jgi:short-subunit dehydrogenase